MVLYWPAWTIGRWSDEDRCIAGRRVVWVQEYGGIAFGEPGFEADDPCQAAGLGDEEGDEECVFHIRVMVGD